MRELVIDDLIHLLSKRSAAMCSAVGGYPVVVREVVGHVVIADAGDCEPILTVYEPEEVAEWLDTLNHYFRIKPGFNRRLLCIKTDDGKPCEPDENFDFGDVYDYAPD